MTQIQEIENLSQPDLVKLIKFERQQHADDMDMLAKELAGKGMRPYSLNLDPLGIRALTSDAITGAFEFGRLNTCRPPEGHWLEPFWKMGNAASPTAPVAAQAQWIEHCSITDIPDAVLTPSGLAIKSEQADTQEPIALVSKKVSNSTSTASALPNWVPSEIRVGRLPTVNQDEYPGLGDWWVQIRIGPEFDEVLARVYGDSPQQAVERAQALASAAAPIDTSATCTCPSGNGSLRWPCPVHPPEE